jgi:hypothetical protein
MQPKSGLKPIHYLISTIFLIIAIVVQNLILLSVGFYVGVQVTRHGGFSNAPLPPAVHSIGGPALPGAYSLRKYVVHVANQGNSESCVSQSLSSMVSIEKSEAGIKKPMSGEYIYGILQPGASGTLTYQDAMNTLYSDGMATLKEFPHENDIYGTYPSSGVVNQARTRNIKRWYSISPTDFTTIRQEVYSGRPVAIAISVYQSFLNGGQSFYPGQSGSFLFYHSILVIGFSSAGLQILNSWGNGWSNNGVATLSWNFIANYANAAVGADPNFSLKKPAPVVKPPASAPWAGLKAWTAYTASNHLKPIPFLYKGKLSQQAKWWINHKKTAWSPTRPEQWHAIKHGHGYEKMTFTRKGAKGRFGYLHAYLFTWPGTSYKPQWR